MNGNLYKTVPLANASYFQKLFKQIPQENAVIELNNLLATKPIKDISKNAITEIEGKYKLSLLREFKLNLEEFYTVYLNHCLADRILNEQELEDLSHLKNVLGLDEKTINELHARLGKNIYKESFQEAIADGRLSKEEEQFLDKLESTLKLPKELANKISEESRKHYVENYVAKIIGDQRLSPDEEKELQAIASSLNITLEINKKTQEQLNKLKMYWALENLDLPVIDVPITMQKSEVCHLKVPGVHWHELRSAGRGNTYGSYSPALKVAKAFYLQSGSNTTNAQILKLIDNGTLYLTNKRIIFAGDKKTSNIKIDKILEITPYSDGVEIRKETGKSPTLQMKHNADVFCVMLERILGERS